MQKKSIAIPFGLNFEQATGLVNYYINLVRALDLLEDKYRPHVVVLYLKNAPINKIEELNYPYISFINIGAKPRFSFVKRAINKLSRVVAKKNIYTINYYDIKIDTLIDFYFTYDIPVKYCRRLCWIVDFQHRYLPDNFSRESYKWIEDRIETIGKTNCDVLFSSLDAKSDFEKFYYRNSNKKSVLRFASILPENFFSHVCKSPFINKKYFIVSNQFWPHKNHLIVAKAVAELRKMGEEVLILFTGHQSERDPAYSKNLLSFIREKELEENIIFLGFIDRLDQLSLMKNSIAVIQPTLFEGWSTVVEDCISLNKFIMLSDLRVNKEQIQQNCSFFNPADHEELAALILKYWNCPPEEILQDSTKRNTDFFQNIVDVLQLGN